MSVEMDEAVLSSTYYIQEALLEQRGGNPRQAVQCCLMRLDPLCATDQLCVTVQVTVTLAPQLPCLQYLKIVKGLNNTHEAASLVGQSVSLKVKERTFVGQVADHRGRQSRIFK